MTPKPAPRTVHHPLAILKNLLTFRCSRLHRRGSWPTSTTLLASRRSRSFQPATAPTATNTLRCPRLSSLPHSAHDFEHLAMLFIMLTAMQLPRCVHLSALTFAIFAAQPTQNFHALRRFHLARAAGWPRFVLVLRRSRHARLHGACARVRLSTFALASTLRFQRRPFLRTSLVDPFARSRFVLLLAKQSKRAHLLVLVSAFVFRRSRPDALRRLTVHGLASSCHVSTAHSSDPLSVRGPSPCAAPVNRAHAHLATIMIALPYGFLRAKHVLRHAPPMKPSRAFA